MKASSVLSAATLTLTLSFSQVAIAALKVAPMPQPKHAPEQMKPLPAPLPLTPRVCVINMMHAPSGMDDPKPIIKAANPVYPMPNVMGTVCNTFTI